jgi:hypothetical protein
MAADFVALPVELHSTAQPKVAVPTWFVMIH